MLHSYILVSLGTY